MTKQRAALIGAAICLGVIGPASAQQGWRSSDAWRAPYRVGDKVQLSISGSEADYQTCVVTENNPDDLMRARCDAFKYWSAGVYIASASSTRPVTAAQAPAAAPGRAGGVAPAQATAGWTPVDDWRRGYKVGQPVNMSISGYKEDMQTCIVTENEPGQVMRARCNRFKSWTAGDYIVGADSVAPPFSAAKSPPPRPAAGNSTRLKAGEYACTGAGGRIMIGLSFKVISANRYTDLDGRRSGTFAIANGKVTFSGGHLAGLTGRDLKDDWFTMASGARCGPY